MRKYIFFLLSFLVIRAYSQTIEDKVIVLPQKDMYIENIFLQIKQEYNIVFSYNNNLLANKKIHFDKTNLTVLEIIKLISAEAEVNYKIQGNKVILYNKKKKFILNGNVKDSISKEIFPSKGVYIVKINSATETGFAKLLNR